MTFPFFIGRLPSKWSNETIVFMLKMCIRDSMSPDQLKLYSQMSNKSLNAAKVFIAMVPMMCVYPFLQRYFVTGVLLGAVKG